MLAKLDDICLKRGLSRAKACEVALQDWFGKMDRIQEQEGRYV